MRVPTEKQYRWLLMLGSGHVRVVPARREVEPFLRHGWVTATFTPGDRYRRIRITADGLRALAAAVDRYGLPGMPGKGS